MWVNVMTAKKGLQTMMIYVKNAKWGGECVGNFSEVFRGLKDGGRGGATTVHHSKLRRPQPGWRAGGAPDCKLKYCQNLLLSHGFVYSCSVDDKPQNKSTFISCQV